MLAIVTRGLGVVGWKEVKGHLQQRRCFYCWSLTSLWIHCVFQVTRRWFLLQVKERQNKLFSLRNLIPSITVPLGTLLQNVSKILNNSKLIQNRFPLSGKKRVVPCELAVLIPMTSNININPNKTEPSTCTYTPYYTLDLGSTKNFKGN